MFPFSQQGYRTGLARIKGTILLLFSVLWFPTDVFSHGMKITARMDNRQLVVESSLEGHKLPKGSEVVVTDNQSKKELLKGAVATKGIFKVPLPTDLLANPVDLLVSVSDRYGHHAKTVVKHELYEGLLPQKQKSQSHTQQPQKDQPEKELPTSQESLRQMMGELMEQKLSPVRAQLAALEKDRVSFRDIIGGIGYLVGLAGLAAWMRSRK